MNRKLLILPVLLISVASCASSAKQGTPTTSQTPAAHTIDGKLAEYYIAPTPATSAAGAVTFHLKNTGTVVHELVVIRSDLSPDALPIKTDGSADEAKLDGRGETGDMAAGAVKDLTLTLTPGKYVLICNVTETRDGKTQSHYKLGMRTAFTVS